MNRLFVLSFENNAHWTMHKRYFLPTLYIKNHDVMINRRYDFDQPVKIDKRIYDNIQKIKNGLGGDFKTGCLLDIVISKHIIKL